MKIEFLMNCGVYRKGDIVNMEDRRASGYLGALKNNHKADNPVFREPIVKKYKKPKGSKDEN